MTAENEGTGAPGGDDPFAYLYRPEGGSGSTDQTSQTSNASSTAANSGQPPRTGQQPGVPRRSYNHVRAVGERQYGNQQRPYPESASSAHYAAPETVMGGRAATRQPPQQPPPPARQGAVGRNRNGLMFAAVGVVAAVVIGIGAAVFFNNDDKAVGDDRASGEDAGGAGDEDGKSGGGDGAGENDDKDDKDKNPGGLPQAPATELNLAGGARPATDLPGAETPGGSYVAGIDSGGSGASATWQPEPPKSGSYKLYVRYGVPGEDMNLSLSVNGKPHQTGLDMQNYARAKKGDWAKGWTRTWAIVQLKEGKNNVKISCEQGDKCAVNLAKVWLKPTPASEQP